MADRSHAQRRSAQEILRESYDLRKALRACTTVDRMVALLRQHLGTYKDRLDRPLREFACWCADDAAKQAHGRPSAAVDLARRFAAGFAGPEELAAMRESLAGAAAAAGVIGLRKCAPSAAAALSAWTTCDADAFEAATRAAFYGVKTGIFAAAHVRVHACCAVHRCAGCREAQCVAQWLGENGKQLAPLEVALRARQVQTLSWMLGAAQVGSRILVFIPEVRQRARPGRT